MHTIEFPYVEFNNVDQIDQHCFLGDHLGGFDSNNRNFYLDMLQSHAERNNTTYKVTYHQILSPEVKQNYKNLELVYSVEYHDSRGLRHFHDYQQHPDINYKNFICSFNGSPHISRKLLVSILNKFSYFDTAYSSKNFVYTTEQLDGHIHDIVGTNDNFYQKFFIDKSSESFFQSIYTFDYTSKEHLRNIQNLEYRLTESFVHVVSETLATSYQPFVTEKFLYSVVTRGLFLAYAQPGWHSHLEKYYGFKNYNKLFDYRFDSIQNPIERLIELITMVSKFKILTTDDWKDLYQLEQETIEYNYDHYFSKRYLTHLKQYDQS